MINGNIVEVLAGVISGVIDGEISPSQAQAVNGSVSQMVKVARLKIEHKNTILDSVVVKKRIAPSVSTENLRVEIYNHVAGSGDSSFKEIAASIGIEWQAVEKLSKHEWFTVEGNRVSIKS